ncbi:efflux RND transporter periplasmic adaptor subunit [Clostridium rectalis]|uniref:efflux RND transporter periplasmic adaptor subunit n=1 Tax=Clostridium rectalis TaxID=2040295 RepID=UPI000F6355E1|nr:biotin/lipoyl-binding protein [Clostridium rectalis]
MENKRKLSKKMIILIAVLIVIISIGVYTYIGAKKGDIKQVNASKVTKQNLVESATANGNIEANYRNDIVLNPAQKVVKVLVKEGQQVKKGDILVQLDATDYKSQLDKQNINLQNANTTLNQLQGASVANEKSNAENAISQGQITLDNAKNNYQDSLKKFQQAKSLYEGGYISKNEYEAAQKAVKDAENAVKAAELALKNSKNALSNIDTTTGDKVTNQKNQIALINADIKSLNEKIEQCNIRAGVNGKVVKIDAKGDQYPKTGDTIIIDDTSKYKLTLDVNQYDAVKIKKGQKANVKIKGIDKKYTGTVSEIAEVAQAKTNMAGGSDQEFKVNVKIILDNSDGLIKGGYEAEGEIILNEKESALAIGFDAIKNEKSTKRKYVYILDGENKVRKRYITEGLETEYDVEIIDGLKEGEKYIINPPENIAEGEVVEEIKK